MTNIKNSILVFTILCCLQGCNNSADFNFSHTERQGSSAKAFLTADDFEKLTIEIDYYKDYPVNAEVINNLQTFLEERLHKPGGISVVLDDELTDEDAKIFYNELRLVDMEESHRDIFTTENNLAAYIMVLNGIVTNKYAGGLAYYNTSAATFPETYYPVADTVEGLRREDLITAVLIHEVGHLLGLVNIGTPLVENHAYEAQKGHCMVKTCAMWPALNSENVTKLKSLKKTPELGTFCLQDLRANGGK